MLHLSGLHPERHGIVGNYIYNRETKQVFGMDYDDMRDPSWWDQHIPVWISATEAGLHVNIQ